MLNIKLMGKGANALSEKISKTGLICNIKLDADGDKSLRVLLTGDTSEITLGVSIVSSLANTVYDNCINDSGMVENETWSLNTIARPKFKRRQLIKGGVNIVLYIEVIRPNIAFGYNADDLVSELEDKRLLNGCDYFVGTPPGTNGCTICIHKGFDSLIVTNIMKYISERYDVRDISRSSRPIKSFELTVKEDIKAQAVGAMNITPGAGKLTNWGIPTHYMPDDITDPLSIMAKLETTCKRINKQNRQYEKLHSEHRLVNAENKQLSIELALMRKGMEHVLNADQKLVCDIKGLEAARNVLLHDNLILKDERTALQNYVNILETEREQLKLKLEDAMASHRKINAEKIEALSTVRLLEGKHPLGLYAERCFPSLQPKIKITVPSEIYESTIADLKKQLVKANSDHITEREVWLGAFLKHLRHDNGTQCVELANNSVIEFKKVFDDKR